jgi:hypothetical protein
MPAHIQIENRLIRSHYPYGGAFIDARTKVHQAALLDDDDAVDARLSEAMDDVEDIFADHGDDMPEPVAGAIRWVIQAMDSFFYTEDPESPDDPQDLFEAIVSAFADAREVMIREAKKCQGK